MKLGAWLYRRIYTWKGLTALYLILLVFSHLARLTQGSPPTDTPDQHHLLLPAYQEDQQTSKILNLAYRDLRPSGQTNAPTIVFLHGSPQASDCFDPILPALRDHYRIILPDMPGFGASSPKANDYSTRSQAHYLHALLKRLNIHDAHIIAYGIGGGTALEANDIDPKPFKSLTLLSAIGVQEYELLGNHTLNHTLYAIQLGVIWFKQEAIPHFGLLDQSSFNLPYARSFLDTDQRPYRSILQSLQPPVLILHSKDNQLIIPETAEEHHRLIPQSTLTWLPDDFALDEDTATSLIEPLEHFIQDVEQGHAPTRTQATTDRLANSLKPFVSQRKPISGIGLIIVGVILGIIIHISEDLIAISAGIIASQGLIPLWLAVIACMLGIYIGDFLIYLGGRWLGTRGVRRAPMRWMISEAKLERSAQWFDRRGLLIVFLTRFIPGTRFPVYFTAGVLRLNWLRFNLVFLLSCLVWTPLIVGLSYFVGAQLMDLFQALERFAMPAIIAVAAIIYLAMRISFRATRARHQKKKQQKSQIH